jgi:hypothetical protein
MSLRPRAVPLAGAVAPANRLHTVLSAGLGKDPPATSATSATSTAPRGLNPRVIRLDPAKADTLRRTLQTDAKRGSRRLKYRPPPLERLEDQIVERLTPLERLKDKIIQALTDRRLTGSELAGWLNIIAEGVTAAQDGIRECDAAIKRAEVANALTTPDATPDDSEKELGDSKIALRRENVVPDELQRVKAVAKRQKEIMHAVIASLMAIVAAGGLISQVLATAEEAIIPDSTWGNKAGSFFWEVMALNLKE